MAGNYSKDPSTEENWNINNKYSVTGESEFSRDSTIPFDEDEVLSERHYTFSPFEELGKKRVKRKDIPSSWQRGHRGKGPKKFHRSDDDIREDVSETLYRSGEVDASEIEVYVAKGQVKLKGTVRDWHQKRMAEFLSEGLAGVDEVVNEIRVKGQHSRPKPSPYGLTDNITGLN